MWKGFTIIKKHTTKILKEIDDIHTLKILSYKNTKIAEIIIFLIYIIK